MTQTATPLPYQDRRALALSSMVLTFLERDGFWSDCDLMDTAEAFTTDPDYTDEEDGSRPRPDYDALLVDLDEMTDRYLVSAGVAVFTRPSDPIL